jgi:CheY-like chemotaxis protein
MGPPSSRRRATCLLVDDHTTTRRLHLERLEKEGFEVIAIAEPSAALTLAQTAPPTIIFVHIGRWGSGNSAFIQSLRSNDNTRHIPVAILANYYDASLERQGLVPLDIGSC